MTEFSTLYFCCSAPQWDKGAFLHEIEDHKPLKHVEEIHDRSSPQIEHVQIKRNAHGELMDEIRATGTQGLKHVQNVADRSEPQVSHTAAMRCKEEH
ncbi:hypothetical protein GPECTOR_2g1242 [Gonium pectorale]|uniref:WH2 domain-containing protein n=1 Tax=Gonium pectorale TaxID=33097 RepID=A0A150H147_GONPE|nr:hypothetical protein GPECTOR_2g1242 [Gonium pectorale]|eukprot:KXZ55692.1 hypothetical protein GPECTOR_2g1242 [Gonium pectorale]